MHSPTHERTHTNIPTYTATMTRGYSSFRLQLPHMNNLWPNQVNLHSHLCLSYLIQQSTTILHLSNFGPFLKCHISILSFPYLLQEMTQHFVYNRWADENLPWIHFRYFCFVSDLIYKHHKAAAPKNNQHYEARQTKQPELQVLQGSGTWSTVVTKGALKKKSCCKTTQMNSQNYRCCKAAASLQKPFNIYAAKTATTTINIMKADHQHSAINMRTKLQNYRRLTQVQTTTVMSSQEQGSGSGESWE